MIICTCWYVRMHSQVDVQVFMYVCLGSSLTYIGIRISHILIIFQFFLYILVYLTSLTNKKRYEMKLNENV